MKILLTILLLTTEMIAFSQSDTISENRFIIPRNLNECLIELNKTFTNKAKEKLTKLNQDSIGCLYNIYILHEWFRPDSSRLKKYFVTKGLRYEYEMEYFVLLSFYKQLKTGNGDISNELKKYSNHLDSIAQERRKECAIKQELDTIEHVYIPKDLLDSYYQLDKILCDSLKTIIKNSKPDNIYPYPFDFGRYIRNNWGLWNCSRLNQYFRNNKIYHPDNMSFLILEGYRHYLNDTILTIQEISAFAPKPPPPTEAKYVVRYKPPKDRKKNKFLRKKKIEDFEISDYNSMK